MIWILQIKIVDRSCDSLHMFVMLIFRLSSCSERDEADLHRKNINFSPGVMNIMRRPFLIGVDIQQSIAVIST